LKKNSKYSDDSVASLMEAEEALRTIKDPLLRRDIISLGYVHGLTSSGNRVSFTLRLPSPASPPAKSWQVSAVRHC
jgi:metal-sulfur cluster biosynthetic enzyme